MENILKELAIKLNVTINELKRIITQILTKETYQEDLLEFIGYDSMYEVEEICKNKSFFEENIEEKKYYTEYKLPEFKTKEVDEGLLISTSQLGEDKKYFNYLKFNPVQSEVFESAYLTNENILICAPTGSGKTDVALLTILRALKQKNSKIIYIVPMKALASEITHKYKTVLKNKVILEFTGDTEPNSYHLTKADIIICTPEKFDAYTRKLSNVLQNYLSLVVIDEIHILEDERGAVIESIVSRIFRYIELKQRTIRIIGLSATLPNFEDIGRFIRASKVFNFDQTYRPVSLKTSIIGIQKKTSRAIKDEIFIEKVNELRNQNKQVIIFVNSRQDTIYTGKLLVDEGVLVSMKNDIKLSESLNYLVSHKIGVHNAGLPKQVRSFMEEKFKSGCLDVLVSTSTLAWGVNLPAHAVIIKGTTYYDPEIGKFRDMGILDIFQIFGRAGRPQYKITGEAYLITENEKVGMYLNMIRNNIVIESKLLKHIVDVLNAEIYLNSVISISTGLEWFKNTFMHTRLKKNPTFYGIKIDERDKEDEVLAEYILLSIKRLSECLLINIEKKNVIDTNTWVFESTEFGRITSFYYLHHSTIKNWLKGIEFIFDEESILKLLLKSKDFSNMLLRGDEEYALNEICEYLKVPFEKTEEHKLYVLLMAHIQNFYVSKFSLKCDLLFIVKNIERILNSFIEVLLYVKKYELVRKSIVLLKRIKKQKRDKICLFEIQVEREKAFLKVKISPEENVEYWCFMRIKDEIMHIKKITNKLEIFLETECNNLEIEIFLEHSLDILKLSPKVIEKDLNPFKVDTFEITFNVVYYLSFLEFQKKFILALDFNLDKQMFLICKTKSDANLLERELTTRKGLLNLSEGFKITKKILRKVGKNENNFICISTVEEALNIQEKGLFIFLSCKTSNGEYLPISDILKICKGRKAILNEDKSFINYFQRNVLNH